MATNSGPSISLKEFKGSQEEKIVRQIFKDIKRHEIGIRKLLASNPSTTSKDTQIMTGLAHHLFSQLVPNNKYEVDKYAKQLPKTCGCGCNGDIYGGDTSIVPPVGLS
ncbi:uncharacterized protein LOC117319659 isoform X2 [Pecten maximus]|uniref:uncharacterized protein LOC117319659 isoform X2 n=1 Tax=Pecten maximus TaxID=6579 RepID=UPI00145814E0|nr:uncharacterized protein LOC117319659 isoform X2 [Pecten maximus]